MTRAGRRCAAVGERHMAFAVLALGDISDNLLVSLPPGRALLVCLRTRWPLLATSPALRFPRLLSGVSSYFPFFCHWPALLLPPALCHTAHLAGDSAERTVPASRRHYALRTDSADLSVDVVRIERLDGTCHRYQPLSPVTARLNHKQRLERGGRIIYVSRTKAATSGTNHGRDDTILTDVDAQVDERTRGAGAHKRHHWA